MLTTYDKTRALLAALYTGRRWEVETLEDGAVNAASPGGTATIPNGSTALEIMALLDENELIDRSDADRQAILDQLTA